MEKSKQVYARIESEKTIVQLAEECERRDISRPDFVREAIELHLKNNDFADVIDARDKLKQESEIAERKINSLERLQTDLYGMRRSLISERDELKKQLSLAQDDFADVRDARDELKKQLANVQDKFKEVAEARDVNANQRDRFKEQFVEAKDKYENVRRECDKAADYASQIEKDYTESVKEFDRVELELEKANDANNVQEKRNYELKERNYELNDARDANANQRDKFKQKFEEVVRINEILLSDVRRMQSLGVFARAFELKRFNTAKYVIQTGKDNETSA